MTSAEVSAGPAIAGSVVTGKREIRLCVAKRLAECMCERMANNRLCDVIPDLD